MENEHLVNVSKRLEKLRRRRGLNWQELAKILGVSRVMLHYLRAGTKPLGVKLDYRIRALEEAHQHSTAPTKKSVQPLSPLQVESWMEHVKRRWKRNKSTRTEMTLAIRIVFEDDAEAVLSWLGKR